MIDRFKKTPLAIGLGVVILLLFIIWNVGFNQQLFLAYSVQSHNTFGITASIGANTSLDTVHTVSGQINSLDSLVKMTTSFADGLSTLQLFEKKRYKESYKQLIANRDILSAEEKRVLGFQYLHGLGVQIKYSKALDWLNAASKEGLLLADSNLGFMYEKGLGVKKNPKKAFELYNKSALGGESYGMCNLGYLYENGLGTHKNIKRAFVWYQKSAELDNPLGLNNLAYCYLFGNGVKKDEDLGLKYLKQAADKDHTLAMRNLSEVYEKGIGVDTDPYLANLWKEKLDSVNLSFISNVIQ